MRRVGFGRGLGAQTQAGRVDHDSDSDSDNDNRPSPPPKLGRQDLSTVAPAGCALAGCPLSLIYRPFAWSSTTPLPAPCSPPLGVFLCSHLCSAVCHDSACSVLAVCCARVSGWPAACPSHRLASHRTDQNGGSGSLARRDPSCCTYECPGGGGVCSWPAQRPVPTDDGQGWRGGVP